MSRATKKMRDSRFAQILVPGNNQIEQKQITSAEAAVKHIRRRRRCCISSLGYDSFC